MSEGREKRLKKDLERTVRALKRKAEEFKAKGDLTRAENCLFLAKCLEEHIKNFRGDGAVRGYRARYEAGE